MKWSGLKNGKCPMCYDNLEFKDGMYKCTHCNFKIDEAHKENMEAMHEEGKLPDGKYKPIV